MEDMIGALNTSLKSKDEYEEGAERLKALQKNWKENIYADDYDRLLNISNAFDMLLKQYAFELIKASENEHIKLGMISFDAEKSLAKTLEKVRNGAPFKTLKFIMDYWCSLWYANFDNFKLVPTREEYWDDIELAIQKCAEHQEDEIVQELLKNSDFNETLAKFKINQPATTSSLTSIESEDDNNSLSTEAKVENTSSEEEIVKNAIQKLKEKAKIWTSFEEYNTTFEARRDNVNALNEENKFFHTMLEFVDVFVKKNGFDVICGNPPWIVGKYNETTVCSEFYPKVVVDKKSAPEVKKFCEQQIQNVSDKGNKLKQALEKAEVSFASYQNYSSARFNYPLLAGMQNDLYKSVLVNCFNLVNDNGYMGLVHPTSLYRDAKGQAARKEMYHRLRYSFIFANEKLLFEDVDHHTAYLINVYGKHQEKIGFKYISNLLLPTTIDDSFKDENNIYSSNIVSSFVDSNGDVNLVGAKDRIINVTEKELRLFAKTFENSDEWKITQLPAIFNNEVLHLLEKYSQINKRVKDLGKGREYCYSSALNNTAAVKKGIILPNADRSTMEVDINNGEIILCGPFLSVANPLFKNPLKISKLNSDYSPIDLTKINDNFTQRTIYKPQCSYEELRNTCKVFRVNEKEYKSGLDFYRFAYRQMTSTEAQRTFYGAIISPKIHYIHAINSLCFKDLENLLIATALFVSLPIDCFCRIKKITNMNPYAVEFLPLN